MDAYEERGCKDRDEYLEQLAIEHGTDVGVVTAMASILGEGEDFDGLISDLEDFSYLGLLPHPQNKDELAPSFQYPEGLYDIYSPKAENVAVTDIDDHYEVIIPDWEDPDGCRIEYAMTLEDCKNIIDSVKEEWAKEEKRVWLILNYNGECVLHKAYSDESWSELKSYLGNCYESASGQQLLFA